MQTPEREEILQMLAELTPERFEPTALALFRYQAAANPLYARFLELLGRRPDSINNLEAIPFMPIQFFKRHTIQSGEWTPQTTFTSSATTGQIPSRHLVRDLEWYLRNTVAGFTAQYGHPSQWCVLALLPSYLEREGSSLVAMADHFIGLSDYEESGFFLHDTDRLASILRQCRADGRPTLLLGVSFALLDFAEQHPMDLSGVTIMETGGMKGRRKELTRPELHAVLSRAFRVHHIHSEYGMTELFSQAYARGGNFFVPSATMRVQCTESNDPFAVVKPGRTGVLNIVDLANVDTCAFIATEDLGKVYDNQHFEVIGRLDIAEMRGCNLMVE